MSSGSLEPSLKDALQRFSSGRRYEYWSQYVKALVAHISETEEEGVRSFPETQMLISAWRMLLILSTSHVGPGKSECVFVFVFVCVCVCVCVRFLNACVCDPQSDVMQLTEESVKLKLFMDVLDGTKAAVSGRSQRGVLFSHWFTSSGLNGCPSSPSCWCPGLCPVCGWAP